MVCIVTTFLLHAGKAAVSMGVWIMRRGINAVVDLYSGGLEGTDP